MGTTEERTRLSRETVVDGALALAGEEGLDGLTIRRLAQRLGVTPMALYWHFKNKDELLHAVADRLWSLVDSRVDPALPWPDQLRSIMESLVAVLREHRFAAELLLQAQPGDVRHCFDAMEAALGVLARAGFPPDQAAEICRYGLRTATMLAMGDPGLKARLSPEEAAEFIRHKRLTLEMLPPDRYPHIVQAAGPLARAEEPEVNARFGIDLFIAGVKAMAPGEVP